MSDLQIMTGISILTRGFVQFRQGLPSYYWMIIADISSLTHLACLVLLQNYL